MPRPGGAPEDPRHDHPDPTSHPRRADGTIAAAHGTDLVRRRQDGRVLARFGPPDAKDSAGQVIGGHPVSVALSPGGGRIAWSYVHANCPPGVSCGTRHVRLVTRRDRPAPVAGRASPRSP